ncbi:metallophosphoesterase domain-containing protein 1 [Mycena rosella]|uniref:Metallophosphoesterase domain-containing protein 1 n=1 Tax=Mycena rosella TaxID=1033263 RepID=A0AAD7CMT8_MYCRO|nr:metallophosphoesterase domain-containing protein 1 [Mycena rosella]
MDGLDALLHRSSTTPWERFHSSPALYLAEKVYQWGTRMPPCAAGAPGSLICVVCISDTHNTHRFQPPLPAGDLLIHAGDLTQSGSATEVADALVWLSNQPHAHKVVIARNHDAALADRAARTQLLKAHPTLVFLEDTATTLTVRGRTLCIYGSPHTPRHGSWPFQYPRVHPGDAAPSAAADVWAAVPALTDVLVTHGPPFGHLDRGCAGCPALLAALWRVRPRLHVFGHIHAARGGERVTWNRAQRAYEDVCAGEGGWCVLGFVRCSGGDPTGTVLINAAVVGGFKEEERLGAVVVYI